MASSTLSSSGDEEDLKYGITEDYGDLAATFTYPNLAPRHPESCLAVIDSLDNMEDARSFETGTPKTSPSNATIVAESLLPGMISPASLWCSDVTVEEVHRAHSAGPPYAPYAALELFVAVLGGRMAAHER